MLVVPPIFQCNPQGNLCSFKMFFFFFFLTLGVHKEESDEYSVWNKVGFGRKSNTRCWWFLFGFISLSEAEVFLCGLVFINFLYCLIYAFPSAYLIYTMHLRAIGIYTYLECFSLNDQVYFHFPSVFCISCESFRFTVQLYIKLPHKTKIEPQRCAFFFLESRKYIISQIIKFSSVHNNCISCGQMNFSCRLIRSKLAETPKKIAKMGGGLSS